MREVIREFARNLLEIEGVVNFGKKMPLSSGKVSSVFVDLQCIQSHPELLCTAAKLLRWRIGRRFVFHRIAGVPMGGVPFAAAMVVQGLPMISPRKEKKAHGMNRMIEGDWQKGMRVVAIDDVATTGGSLLRACKFLKKRGLIVVGCCVLLDRKEGAESLLKKKGYDLLSVFTLEKLLSYKD